MILNRIGDAEPMQLFRLYKVTNGVEKYYVDYRLAVDEAGNEHLLEQVCGYQVDDRWSILSGETVEVNTTLSSITKAKRSISNH